MAKTRRQTCWGTASLLLSCQSSVRLRPRGLWSLTMLKKHNSAMQTCQKMASAARFWRRTSSAPSPPASSLRELGSAGGEGHLDGFAFELLAWNDGTRSRLKHEDAVKRQTAQLQDQRQVYRRTNRWPPWQKGGRQRTPSLLPLADRWLCQSTGWSLEGRSSC